MKKSPTVRLLLGLLITLAAVTSFSAYSIHQFNYLRKLQAGIIDLNRHDSLLLLRVQNDLSILGLELQEMTSSQSANGIARYQWEFDSLRENLNNAIKADAAIAPTIRRATTETELTSSLQQFWALWDSVFRKAANGEEEAARKMAAEELSDQQMALERRLSHLLQQDNETEARADAKIASVYDRAERQTYLFLAATIAAILITSLYLIYSNRKIFGKMEMFSRQRRVLAARLITVQEEVLRSVSRELHDEFGQILTAVSAMLARAERKGVPADSPLRTELSEVREITHNTLEKMRSLSQMLHPAILDDYGLAKGIEWYTEVFTRQTGIRTIARIEGDAVLITGATATHCFRIVQEALTNAAKHSRSESAEVDLHFNTDHLTIQIRDFGIGMAQDKKKSKPGLGLIAMRERAELLRAEISVASIPNAGTTVSLVIPLVQDEPPLEAETEEEIGGVLIR